MKKKVEPETLEEHIVSGGALMYVRVWHVARVRLRVTGAHDIRPADWGVSGVLGGRADPYCKVKYQGKQVAKTKVCNSTLDPCWNAVFEFTVPTHAPTEGEAADLLVEVFDHDLVGSDDFLGCAVISSICWHTLSAPQIRQTQANAGIRCVRWCMRIISHTCNT